MLYQLSYASDRFNFSLALAIPILSDDLPAFSGMLYQLSYASATLVVVNIPHAKLILSGRRDSNPRPTAWKAVTLPTELLPPTHELEKLLLQSLDQPEFLRRLVGREGFEPPKA